MPVRRNLARALGAVLVACVAMAVVRGQESAPLAGPLDAILDVYVRDGYVYYRALKTERARFDAYVASLANTDLTSASRDTQLAFWLNAYDAFVLRTVIDHYPIPGSSKEYPPHSIRQVPGAFERLPHRAAGRTVTLDDIEKTILATFQDPRVYFAIGRGTIGGGRLRSEAFSGARVQEQLADVANECAARPECVQLDRTANALSASPVFSWHEREFSERYGSAAPAVFASRSPIERAIIGFVEPKLLTTEKAFLDGNQFSVRFKPYDWRLNDLTGRGGR